MPDWAARIDERTLLIIDEAGMAATGDLAAVTRFALGRGASVRLVGDDRQLASVAAGGVLRDIQATAGAVTLSELIRFRDQAEGAASLAIRAGDTTGIGFYIDRDRVHVGDLATVTDHAYTAWTADRDGGPGQHHAGPHPGAGHRVEHPRPHRPAHPPRRRPRARRSPSSTAPRPAPATWSSPGATTGGCAPAPPTGSRTATGGASPEHTGTGRSTSCTPTPADTSACPPTTSPSTCSSATPPPCTAGKESPPTPATPSPPATESRQQLYVALTRGRDANHIYLVTVGDGDEHTVITPAATHPLTAINLLEQILARDEAQVSATTTSRRLADPAADAAAAAARYHDSLHTAAVHIHGPGLGRAPGHRPRAAVPRDHPQPRLPHPARPPGPARRRRARPDHRGHRRLARSREIDTALDVAAVLDWRLDPTHTRSHTPGPLPWLPGIPQPLRTDPYWGSYLQARQQHVVDAASAVRTATGELTAATAPAWARQLLTPEHQAAAG